jgi:hypothetical protein
LLVVAIALVHAPALFAQAPPTRTFTAADYARAEKFLAAGTRPLVLGASVRPAWLDDGRFTYQNTFVDGTEFIVVDPARKTRTRAFDHARMAAALSAAASQRYEAFDLPFTQFQLAQQGQTIQFDVGTKSYSCDSQGNRCTASTREQDDGRRNTSVSPDGRRAVFIRDWNLWVRDLTSGQEKQLTTDGVKDFGYATDNAGWTKSDRPIVAWSPDSRKVATFQQDERNVGEMYLVSTGVGHPRLEQWKYPLPGDSVIQMIHRVVIDVDAGRVVRLQVPPDAHRSTLCDHIACRGEFADIDWAADSKHVAFVSNSRDHRNAKLRWADAETGAVREVLEETVETQFESGLGRVNWDVLPASNEVIWFSERNDWGNLYLYDLATGKLKNAITTGEGPVLQVLRVDEKSRTVWFTAAGREKGQ